MFSRDNLVLIVGLVQGTTVKSVNMDKNYTYLFGTPFSSASSRDDTIVILLYRCWCCPERAIVIFPDLIYLQTARRRRRDEAKAEAELGDSTVLFAAVELEDEQEKICNETVFATSM